MEKFQEEFLADNGGVVKAATIVIKLADNSVIPNSLKNEILKENDNYTAASKLYNHLKGQGDYKSLKKLCKIMMEEEANRRMVALGEKMLERLEVRK